VAGCSDPPPTPRERAAPVERPIYQLKGPTARLRVPTAALIEHAVVPGVFVLSASGEAANGPSLARDPADVQDAQMPRRPGMAESGLGPIGEARFRMVRPGRIVGGETEILAGLVGDETLVLGDLKTLHDGSPVTAVKSTK
jgi:hypothetical protein